MPVYRKDIRKVNIEGNCLYIIIVNKESVVHRCSWKYVFLKILESSHKNTYDAVYFYFWSMWSVSLLKSDSSAFAFLWTFFLFLRETAASYYSIYFSAKALPGYTCLKPARKTPARCVKSVRSYQIRHENNVIDAVLVSFFLNLNRFNSLLWLFHSCFWTRKCLLGFVSNCITFPKTNFFAINFPQTF